MYMMWDDHEIMDGWGSRYLSGPDDENDEMERIFGDYVAKGLTYSDCRVFLERMEAAAKRVYEEYQHSHNPATEPDIYDYGFRHDRSAFYMLDGRGHRDINRSSHRILGRAQLDRFKKWVESLDDSTSCLFVTSAVPLLHLASSLANMDDTWLAHMTGLEDDLRDAWENELHSEERKELLQILFAAAEQGIGVCILSGDVHMAAAFRMTDRETGAVLYQLTSSAITYNIPRAFGWALGSIVQDSGISDDGYEYQRLALYKQSNFSLIKVDQDNRRIIFQIYGEQETAHPREEVILPMTHSIAKLELGFIK